MEPLVGSSLCALYPRPLRVPVLWFAYGCSADRSGHGRSPGSRNGVAREKENHRKRESGWNRGILDRFCWSELHEAMAAGVSGGCISMFGSPLCSLLDAREQQGSVPNDLLMGRGVPTVTCF